MRRHKMKSLGVRSFGPIREGRIEFGDLTVLVGPQASGKSLFVQLFKLLKDADSIRRTLTEHGLDWSRSRDDFLALYFGEGMQSIWHANTSVFVNEERFDFERKVLRSHGGTVAKESVFVVPAQRALVLQDGWPSPILRRSVEAPYCMRMFSDTLRRLLDQKLAKGESFFPQPRRLKKELRQLIDQSIYVGGKVKLDTQGMRKRLVLQPVGSEQSVPYSAWSAGQREFTPLLLGLYWLIPGSRHPKQRDIETVIIEEPEMGLHPQAIMSFSLLVLVLLHRGYKVIVSTHSPVILDVVWALRELRTNSPEEVAVASLKQIFGLGYLSPIHPLRGVLREALRKTCATYYFQRMPKGKDVYIQDISSLDPGDDKEMVSGWGGLSGFSGRVADVVGQALRQGRPPA